MKQAKITRKLLSVAIAVLIALQMVPTVALAAQTDAASDNETSLTTADAIKGKRIKKRTYKTRDFKLTVPKSWKGKWYLESSRTTGKVTQYWFCKVGTYRGYITRKYAIVYVGKSKKAVKKVASYAEYKGKSSRGRYVFAYSDTSFLGMYGSKGEAKLKIR